MGKKRQRTSDSEGQKVVCAVDGSVDAGKAPNASEERNTHRDTGKLRWRSPDCEGMKGNNGDSLVYAAVGVIRHKLLFSTRPRLVLACKNKTKLNAHLLDYVYAAYA